MKMSEEIDWDGKGNITKEIYEFTENQYNYWKKEAEKNTESFIARGLAIAYLNIIEFIVQN